MKKQFKYKIKKRPSKNQELAIAGIGLGILVIATRSIKTGEKPTSKDAKRLFNLVIRKLLFL